MTQTPLGTAAFRNSLASPRWASLHPQPRSPVLCSIDHFISGHDLEGTPTERLPLFSKISPENRTIVIITMTSDAAETWPQWKLLAGQRDLLSCLRSRSKACDDSRSHSLMFPMLDALEESTGTLLDLVRLRRMRDCYVIARVVYETSVNTCFLLAGGDEVAERAWRHMKQKSLRDLDRSFHIADEKVNLRWSGADEVLKDPDNQRLLDEFTSRSGREITAWTDENVPERLSVIHERYGKASRNLYWALLLYRHASDIAHGSLFGVLFPWGATEPPGPRTIEDMEKFREGNLRHVMMLTASALNSLIQIAAVELGHDDLVESSNAVEKEYWDTPDRGY